MAGLDHGQFRENGIQSSRSVVGRKVRLLSSPCLAPPESYKGPRHVQNICTVSHSHKRCDDERRVFSNSIPISPVSRPDIHSISFDEASSASDVVVELWWAAGFHRSMSTDAATSQLKPGETARVVSSSVQLSFDGQ